MRYDWVPLSASALVIGAMALVFATVLNPVTEGTSAQTVQMAATDGARWLAMSVMLTFTSVALTVGLPAVLLLLQDRGRRTGFVGVFVLAIGAIGTCGYAMLLVFFRALVVNGSVTPALLDRVTDDRGVALFLFGWVACFYAGFLLVAIALLMAGTTPRWVPVVLAVFVLGTPVFDRLGHTASAVQAMLLAASLTGVAMAAVSTARPVEERPGSVRLTRPA